MILIAGYGYVGKAYEALFNNYYETIIVDPQFSTNTIENSSFDCAVVCVATPANEDGSCDMGNIFDVLIDIGPNIPILIKSTIALEGWEYLLDSFPNHDICFSPEFLTQKNYIADVLYPGTIYLGGKNTEYWKDIFYHTNPISTNIVVKEPEELILAKYFRNSFLALKVSFFNQIFDLCEEADIDYTNVVEAITTDRRIGTSHTHITEERGFGGHCFPKDTKAIVSTAKEYDVDLSIIQNAIDYNDDVRQK